MATDSSITEEELWLAGLDDIDWFNTEELRQYLATAPSKDLAEYHYYQGFLAGIQLAPLIEQGVAEIQVVRAAVDN